MVDVPVPNKPAPPVAAKPVVTTAAVIKPATVPAAVVKPSAANAATVKPADAKLSDPVGPVKHLYLCPRAPGVKIKLSTGHVKAVRGVLDLSTSEAAEMDALIKTRPDIRGILKKVDMAAAEAVVRKDRENRRAQAVQGAFASNNTSANILREAKAANDRDAMTRQKPPLVVKEVPNG